MTKINITLPLAGWRQASEQWGYAKSNENVILPIPFANETWKIASMSTTKSYDYTPTVLSKTNRSFEPGAWGLPYDYIAIGFQQWGATTSPLEDVTYPIPVSRVLCLLLTTRATTFRYSPWPTNITTKSFQAVSDSEPVYWFLVAKQQWGVGAPYSDGYSVTTLPIPFSNTDYTVIANSSWLNSGAVMASAVLSVTQIKVRNGGYTDTYHFLTIGRQQWGFGESPYATPTTYTYPLAYSVNVLNVVIGSVGGRESTCRINSVSKDSFVAYRHYSGSGTGSGDLYWLAIGVQQWGVYMTGTRNVTITLPIATSVTYVAIAVARTENNYGCSGSQNCQYVSNVTNKTFQAGSYDSGNGYAGFWWLSIGKAQALPKAHRLKHCYIPTAIQLMFVPWYVGQVTEILVLVIHDVLSKVALPHDSCAVVIQ